MIATLPSVARNDGLGDAFLFPASAAIVPLLVPKPQLHTANAIVQGTAQLSLLERFKFFRTDTDEWVMNAYSLELRKRIVRVCAQGTQTQVAIAERFEVSHWFVVKIWQQWRRTGNLHPRKPGGRRPVVIGGSRSTRIRRWQNCARHAESIAVW